MKQNITFFLLACYFIFTPGTSSAQTGPMVRAIANADAYYDSTGYTAYDSTTYVYSGSRGGGPVYGVAWTYAGKYDTSNVWYKASRPIFVLYYRYTQTFDSHSNLLSQTSQSYDSAHSSWTNVSLLNYTYDANNNMTSNTYSYWNTTTSNWLSSVKYAYSYDVNNNQLTDTTLIWQTSTSSWFANDLQENAYSAHNDLTETISEYYNSGTSTWQNIGKTSYFLNAGYKTDSVIQYVPSGPVWSNYIRDIFTYDGSYNQLTDTTYTWDNILYYVWNPFALRIYSYSSSGNQLTNEYRAVAPDSTWLNSTNALMTYDANHNTLTKILQNWNVSSSSYLNTQKTTNVFNSSNKLLSSTDMEWDNALSAWTPHLYDGQHRYYYEVYTAVSDVSKPKGSIQLYPSPANSYASLDIKWDNAQAATIALYDVNGRLYRQWQLQKGTSYHGAIPTSQLPAGNYILAVKGDSEQMTQQFSVVH